MSFDSSKELNMITKTDIRKDITKILGVDGPSIRTRQWKRWKTVAISLVVAAAIATIWLSAGKGSMVQYKTQEVKRGSLTVVVTATGTLQPTNTVSVGSEVSGIAKER